MPRLIGDTLRTSALSPKSDLVRVTSESSNVLLNPMKSKSLVVIANVGRVSYCYLITRDEPEDIGAMIDGHSDHR